MKEKAESWSRKREVKKRASTTEFHLCIPSTASWREPSKFEAGQGAQMANKVGRYWLEETRRAVMRLHARAYATANVNPACRATAR